MYHQKQDKPLHKYLYYYLQNPRDREISRSVYHWICKFQMCIEFSTFLFGDLLCKMYYFDMLINIILLKDPHSNQYLHEFNKILYILEVLYQHNIV